uniref:Uncharacterized protein n=1 Tax=Arundo donax TaxID=35708 RepID=A0A0A9GBT9_ARUDO
MLCTLSNPPHRTGPIPPIRRPSATFSLPRQPTKVPHAARPFAARTMPLTSRLRLVRPASVQPLPHCLDRPPGCSASSRMRRCRTPAGSRRGRRGRRRLFGGEGEAEGDERRDGDQRGRAAEHAVPGHVAVAVHPPAAVPLPVVHAHRGRQQNHGHREAHPGEDQESDERDSTPGGGDLLGLGGAGGHRRGGAHKLRHEEEGDGRDAELERGAPRQRAEAAVQLHVLLLDLVEFGGEGAREGGGAEEHDDAADGGAAGQAPAPLLHRARSHTP